MYIYGGNNCELAIYTGLIEIIIYIRVNFVEPNSSPVLVNRDLNVYSKQ